MLGLPLPFTGQAFRLTHRNVPSLLFYAEDTDTARKWNEALLRACKPHEYLDF